MRCSLNPQFAPVHGYQLAFDEQGSGPPVLFVHGITTYSFIWRNIVPGLAKHFKTISLDLLGCGDSDKPLSESYALSAHAEHINRFLDNRSIQKVHFVGHDLGGGIGQIMAVRYPEKLHSLTMINTVGYDYWPVQPIISLRTPVIRQLIMATMDMGTFRMVVRRGMYHKDRVTDELMNLFMCPMHSPEGRKAFLHFAKCLDNSDLMDIAHDLTKLTIPTLIIRGDNDVYLSPAIADRLAESIPKAKLTHFPDAGHFIQEDSPDLLSTALVDFLEEYHG